MQEFTFSPIATEIATPISRRSLLGGALLGGAALLLPGCQSMGDFSLIDAIRRLLTLSSERAFTRLIAPDGYWDNAVGSAGLESLLGTRGNVLGNILTSTLFKNRLEGAFADVAVEGAERAAPLVADAVRVIGIDNAVALVQGGPTAATAFLRGNMGSTLVEAMVPELGQAMRITQEPLVGQLLAGLTGIDVSGVARNISTKVDNAVWTEMGVEESAIRANPQATNDPLLIAVLGGTRML